MLKPCLTCGELTHNTYCNNHKPKRKWKTKPKTRTSQTRWKQLSRKLRTAQPWCLHCGTTTNLTVDHIIPVKHAPEREFDETNLQILCKSCNSRKGTQPTPGDTPQSTPPAHLAGKAFSPSHNTGGADGKA